MNTNTASQASSSNQSPKNNHPFTNDDGNEVSPRPRGLSAPITKNETYLDPKDGGTPIWRRAGGRPPKWKRLELLNRGILNGKWSDQTMKRSQDDWYLCQIIAGHLGLSERSKERLWQLYRTLDMGTFKKYEQPPKPEYTIHEQRENVTLPTIRTRKCGVRKQYTVILAISTLLYNQTKSPHQSSYYPGEGCETRPRYGVGCRFARKLVEDNLHDTHELVQQFAKNLGIRDANLRSCIEKLRQKYPQLA